MRPVSITLPADSGQIVTGAGCITFWAIEDTTDSGGSEFSIYDGENTGGQLLLPATTLTTQSFRDFGRPHVLCFNIGLYLDIVSGSIVGQVTAWMEHSCAAVLAAIAAMGG